MTSGCSGVLRLNEHEIVRDSGQADGAGTAANHEKLTMGTFQFDDLFPSS